MGRRRPCGRLPETWPLRLEDTPCYLDFPGDGVTADYREGVYVATAGTTPRKMPVRWPFGHGLSYTGYVYRGAALDADTLTPGGTVTVRVTVKNSGAMRGAEVVQLYVADATGAPVPGGRVPQALRRFAKIDLQPGEEQEIVFMLTPQDISRYSPRAARLVRRAGPVRNTHRAFEPGHPRGAGLTVCGRKNLSLL